MSSGVGVYFDGRTARRQDVHVELGVTALRIIAPDGRPILDWPFGELREVADPSGGLRLTRDGGAALARLEIRDAALAREIRARAPNLSNGSDSGVDRKVVAWSLAAVVSFVVFGLYGLPALIDRVAPALPWSVDRRMGEALDGQIRLILPVRRGSFACGDGPDERDGRAALDALGERLSDAASLPFPVTIVAVRSDIPNALALPGGPVYLFDGLIARAQSADEIAGVLAHEIGHVAARDGARRVLQAGGLSFLFGFVLGDFVGGGAAVAVVRALSEASYSRGAESDADAYSVRLMRKLGADPKALGALLTRLAGEDKADGGMVFGYLASHPDTQARRRAIDDAAAGAPPSRPLMDGPAFAALKRICGARA
ncbi:MAG TPA: M48 family metallopeptidase [Hansschlegelia sp.]